MGVRLFCKKGRLQFYLKDETFIELRMTVAKVQSDEFGKLYSSLPEVETIEDYDEREKWCDRFNEKLEELIVEGEVDASVADFCLKNDTRGEIDSDDCSYIYDTIKRYSNSKDYDDSNFSFNDFKKLLQECIKLDSPMAWD